MTSSRAGSCPRRPYSLEGWRSLVARAACLTSLMTASITSTHSSTIYPQVTTSMTRSWNTRSILLLIIRVLDRSRSWRNLSQNRSQGTKNLKIKTMPLRLCQRNPILKTRTGVLIGRTRRLQASISFRSSSRLLRLWLWPRMILLRRLQINTPQPRRPRLHSIRNSQLRWILIWNKSRIKMEMSLVSPLKWAGNTTSRISGFPRCRTQIRRR